jgi:hypothetical protein
MAVDGIMRSRNWTDLYEYIDYKKYRAGFLKMEVEWMSSKQ